MASECNRAAGGRHYRFWRISVSDEDNHLHWRGPAQSAAAWPILIKWVEAVEADTSDIPQHDKVVLNRPDEAVDGCWDASVTPARFIAEPQTFSSKPDSRCNTLYPSGAFPRYVAGGPLAGNKYKCRLKPITLTDYSVTFSAAEVDTTTADRQSEADLAV